MTDEKNFEIREEKNTCFCQSKGFRKFLITAGATFVGVFCALSLFAALHKPPMPPCPMAHHMMYPPAGYHHMHKFNKPHKCDFHKKFEKRDLDKKIPVKVNIENNN